MDIDPIKLKLIRLILASEDEDQLKEALEILQSGPADSVAEEQTEYSLQEEKEINLEDLSPEFRAAIKEGLAQLERGEFYTDEEDEKYWEQWFKEN